MRSHLALFLPILILATLRTTSYKQRLDQLRDYLITNSAKPLLQSYIEAFKKQQAALEASAAKDGKSAKKATHSATMRSVTDGEASEVSRHFPLVFFAEQFLARSLKVLAQSRSNLIRFDGSSMFDRNWVNIVCSIRRILSSNSLLFDDLVRKIQ